MGVPKKRSSHSRNRKRRTHQALEVRSWVECPQCREPMTLHHVCGVCGFYRNRPVLERASE